MVKMTQSFSHWLFKNHRDKFGLVMLGHVELVTEEMYNEYLAWCQTEDGKQYLEGGTKYRKENDNAEL